MKRLLLVCIVCILTPLMTHAGTWPNMPAGSTIILDCQFDTPDCSGAIPSSIIGNGVSIATDSAEPESPPNYLRQFRAASVNQAGVQLDFPISPASPEIYMGATWRAGRSGRVPTDFSEYHQRSICAGTVASYRNLSQVQQHVLLT